MDNRGFRSRRSANPTGDVKQNSRKVGFELLRDLNPTLTFHQVN
jgi:hypothetical protein